MKLLQEFAAIGLAVSEMHGISEHAQRPSVSDN